MNEAQHIAENTEPCARCGGDMEFIPYQDQAGCASALIEMWRCQECGKVVYGDVIGYGFCDLDSAFMPPDD